MAISKELEALVISSLARMNDKQFRKALKASLDGRRIVADKKPAKTKPKKKLHWKTKAKIEREQKAKAKTKKHKAKKAQVPPAGTA